MLSELAPFVVARIRAIVSREHQQRYYLTILRKKNLLELEFRLLVIVPCAHVE